MWIKANMHASDKNHPHLSRHAKRLPTAEKLFKNVVLLE